MEKEEINFPAILNPLTARIFTIFRHSLFEDRELHKKHGVLLEDRVLHKKVWRREAPRYPP